MTDQTPTPQQTPTPPPALVEGPGTQTVPLLPRISLWERTLRLRDAAVVWLGAHHLTPGRFVLGLLAAAAVTFGSTMLAHKMWERYHPVTPILAADPPKAAPMPEAKRKAHPKAQPKRGPSLAGQIKSAPTAPAQCAAFVCGR